MTNTVEFSRPVDIASVFRKGQLSLALEARPEERKAIATRLGLAELASLRADLSLKPWQEGGLMIRGTLSAELTQTCVVTLEPLPGQFNAPVEARYLPGAEAALLKQDEALSDPEQPDPPEPLPAGGAIDLGELVIQHLAVALDPYPRKSGVAFKPPEAGTEAISPFAKLTALKNPPKA